MSDSSSSGTTNSFKLSTYKEPATALLTVLAPPAAIAVRHGKVDLESRHLALSLALYLSVICYVPAVLHAYWLLYVRDNGGVEEWSKARLRQAEGLWNEHGGVAKAKVDEIVPKVRERVDRARTFTTDKVKYATDKKDQAVSYVTDTRVAVRDLVEEAKQAYADGTAIDWTKEKVHVVAEKAMTLLESYPLLKSLVPYAEMPVALGLDFIGKINEMILTKHLPTPTTVNEEGSEAGSMGDSGRWDRPLTSDEGSSTVESHKSSSRNTEGDTADEGGASITAPLEETPQKKSRIAKANQGKKSGKH